MKVDILEYLGKHDNGVIVLLSINYEDIYYDATFFYNNEFLALTPDESFEEKIGSQIEDWDKYTDLVYLILSKVVPYEEIINIVSDFDPSKYDLYLDKN
jgi:hypothetical protein